MGTLFRFFTCILVVIPQFLFAADFNYGSGYAAKSGLTSKSLITAMEQISDRIYAVGVHGIIIYSDDLSCRQGKHRKKLNIDRIVQLLHNPTS